MEPLTLLRMRSFGGILDSDPATAAAAGETQRQWMASRTAKEILAAIPSVDVSREELISFLEPHPRDRVTVIATRSPNGIEMAFPDSTYLKIGTRGLDGIYLISETASE